MMIELEVEPELFSFDDDGGGLDGWGMVIVES